jgi:isopenicillin-N N-acyltransferase-like protein
MQAINCFGTGFERGLAHGESARQMVRDALAQWEAATLSGLRHPVGILDYAKGFLDQTGLFAKVRQTLPDLAEEVRGIAVGAGISEDLIAAYNLMDEQWWYDLDCEPKAEPGCSLIGLLGAKGTVLAQNMDLPAYMDGSQVVLRVGGPEVPETLLLSAAGLIGLTGVNRNGVAICVNTLLMLRHQTGGMPVAFALRHALAAKSAPAAVERLQNLSHASGQHYAVADSVGLTSLECSAGGAVARAADETTLLHTNHPLQSADLDARAMAYLTRLGRVANSETRLAWLCDRVEPQRPETVEALLSDPATPLCMVADQTSRSQTFGSVLFNLGNTPEARFRLGLPGKAAWHQVGFSN